jgi:hypothetical protein
MSVALRTRRNHPTALDSPADATVASERPPHEYEGEAPERGVIDREAPETGVSDRAEAPDRGEGRAHYLEHEFTHGRSQS